MPKTNNYFVILLNSLVLILRSYFASWNTLILWNIILLSLIFNVIMSNHIGSLESEVERLNEESLSLVSDMEALQHEIVGEKSFAQKSLNELQENAKEKASLHSKISDLKYSLKDYKDNQSIQSLKKAIKDSSLDLIFNVTDIGRGVYRYDISFSDLNRKSNVFKHEQLIAITVDTNIYAKGIGEVAYDPRPDFDRNFHYIKNVDIVSGGKLDNLYWDFNPRVDLEYSSECDDILKKITPYLHYYYDILIYM